MNKTIPSIKKEESARKKKVYTLDFALLCLASVLFAASFNMIIPELPDYLTQLGGKEYKGLIISLFTTSALLSRPFSGKLSDTVGRVPVMAFGFVVCFIVGFMYPLLVSVVGFLFLRFLHGFSTGFTPTAINAYIADIIPDDRRGEALGISGFFFSLGMALGPYLGGEIMLRYESHNILFGSSSAVALVSVLFLLWLKEPLQNKQKFSFKHLKISSKDIYDPKVLPAALVLLLAVTNFGTALTIIPDFTKHLGIANKGIYFIYLTGGSIFVRLVAGKVSDKVGRIPVLVVGVILLFFGFIALGFVQTPVQFYWIATIIGVSIGINSPTIFAWGVDLGNPKNKGRTMSTIFIGLEFGIGLGAIGSAAIYNNDNSRFQLVFWLNAAVIFLSLLYLLFLWAKTIKKDKLNN